MKNKFINFLKTSPLFAWLLPVFFTLHGFVQLNGLIPVYHIFILTIVYLSGITLLYFIFWFIYRNIYKAALLSFFVGCFNFFFGPMHDWIKNSFPNSFFSKYSFILPVTLFTFLLLGILLKKRKKTFHQLTSYLNMLMTLLLIIDIVLLIQLKISDHKPVVPSNEFTDCSSCLKPDIYYILADEYAGKKELADLFGFDNSTFENALQQRGFYIVENSKSNYNYTMFSAPSILNMDYVPGIERKNSSVHDRKICNDVIGTNKTCQFLNSLGYEFYNYSIFDIAGKPTGAKSSFLPVSIRPLVAQTFLYRVTNDLWFHLVTDLDSKSAKEGMLYKDKINNENFIRLTKKIAAKKTSQPKFVYTHLLMPHYPYYYDKNGNEVSYDKLGAEYDSDTSRYISYLQYCNKKFLDLIDAIINNSSQPPIIIFMSDHGFKSFKNEAHPEYHFYNFNSIFLPDSNYASFYDGISNVNQFRVLLNNQFNQKLPLLKDSTILITEQ